MSVHHPQKKKKTAKSSSKKKMQIVNDIRAELEQSSEQKSEREVCAEVAERHGKQLETVRSLWKRSKVSKKKQHGNQLVTDEDEAMLTGVLEAFSLCHTPLSRQQFLDLVRETCGFKEDWKGYDWFDGFMKRQKPYVAKRIVQAIKESRVTKTVLKDTKEFVQAYEKCLEDHHFSSQHIVNADETRLRIDELFTEVYIESNKKKKYTYKAATRSEKTASLLVFATADGQVILSVYILPANFNEKDEANISVPLYKLNRQIRGQWPRLYAFTSSGYLNNETWSTIMKYYRKLTAQLWPGVHSLLLLDKLGAHMQADVVAKCLKKGVHTLLFPSNASHFIQPLDDKMFTNFKQVLKEKATKHLRAAMLHHKKPLSVLVAVAPEAETQAFNPDIVTSSFHHTGIWPFNSNLILGKAKQNSIGYQKTKENSPPSVRDQARQAAMNVLKENTPTTKTKNIKAKVKKNQLYTSEQIIEYDDNQKLQKKIAEEEKAKKQEDKAKRKKEKEEAIQQRKKDRKQRNEEKESLQKKQELQKQHRREVNTCRVCAMVWKSSQKWMGCEHCEVWWLCAKCAKDTEELTEHEKICAEMTKKKKSSK